MKFRVHYISIQNYEIDFIRMQINFLPYLLFFKLKVEFTLEKAEKLRRLQEEYEDSLACVGEAQKTAIYQVIRMKMLFKF